MGSDFAPNLFARIIVPTLLNLAVFNRDYQARLNQLILAMD